jgi:hypothetical protein
VDFGPRNRGLASGGLDADRAAARLAPPLPLLEPVYGGRRQRQQLLQGDGHGGNLSGYACALSFVRTKCPVSVIKVFETASRANGGRHWLVWLMTLRGSPLVLQAA